MAKAFKVNSNYTVKQFSDNYGSLKQIPEPVGEEDRLETQYENLQGTLEAAGQTYDSRNWMEKLLGINADTKEHAGILRGTLDIITRPLDAVKGTLYSLEQGKGGQEVFQNLIQGITQGKGKNLTGTQILGLENAHLDTFTSFIVNVGVDIGLDPLTYVPAGAIFKGLKKGGASIGKLPGISDLLQHAKTTELGVAVKNLHTTTKNQFGKLFKWMYGTSDESKFLFSKIEADKNVTTHEMIRQINQMLDVTKEASEDLFNYAKTGQIPGSKSFQGIFPDAKKSIPTLDHTLERLGIQDPEKLFTQWAKDNYNGNIAEAKNNLLLFMTDPKMKAFKEDWQNYITTGANLNPNGTQKDLADAASSFWLKKTKEWQQLTPEEVRMRFNHAVYQEYLLTNPPEKTISTVLKALNNGEFPLPINDPEAIRNFLKNFSEVTGLHDPLLQASFIERDVIRNGKKVYEVDTNLVKDLEKKLVDAKTAHNAYSGGKVKEIQRLKGRVNTINKSLETAKKGIKLTERVDIGELIAKEGIEALPSSYFNFKSMKDYGKTASKNLERMLNKMKLSEDATVRLEYTKMMQGNQLNTVRAWLKDAEGKGVMVSLKNKWNPENIKYFSSDGNIITQGQGYKALRKGTAGETVKKSINKEITNGLNAYLKGKMTDKILADGVLGRAIKDWKAVDGLTKENVIEVANKLTDDILKTKIELPSYQLTPYKGYMSEQYVKQLSYLNSEMYRMITRFGLDPSMLQQANILRNVINPELATHMRLINIQKNLDTTEFLALEKKLYGGANPSKVLNSQWLLNAPEINHALGYNLLSTDPLRSMQSTLQILPETLSLSAMFKGAIKNGDIRILTDIEKVSFEVKSVVPQGKKLIKTSEVTRHLEGIRDLVPTEELKIFDETLKSFGEERNLLISIGLDDQLQNLTKMKKEAPSVVNYLNKYISAWKKVVLLTPGYHARNMFGNISQTVSAGVPMHIMTPELNQAYLDVVNVNKITNKISTQLKTTTEILDTDAKFANFTKSFLSPYEHNLFHEYTGLMRNGITGQAKVNSDYWEMMNKLGKTAAKNNNFKKGWDTIFNANMKLSQSMDDGFRLAAYRISMKNPKYAMRMGLKGNTAEELSHSFVRTVFFDYNALTSFEKNTMRKIFPFYTWSRKNLEYQVRTLINRPEKFGRMLKIFDDWNAAQGYDKSEEPDWVKENMWLPIVKGDNVKFLKVGLPQQDLNEVFGGNGKVLSRLNPFYKLALESITGTNVFTQEKTTPLKSLQGMFWQPIQKLLVQPFDIPVGALPLGNGKTLGEVFGHPNDYSQKTSLWYEQNIQSLHQSYLWQQINKLAAFRQQLRAMGINIQTKQQLLQQMKKSNLPNQYKLQNYKQFRITSKNLRF